MHSFDALQAVRDTSQEVSAAPPQTESVFAARQITKVYHMGEVDVHALRGVPT
jgi:hypothetical protein